MSSFNIQVNDFFLCTLGFHPGDHCGADYVMKPTPYSNSPHFSDHFAYHIAFPLLSHDCQAHVRLLEQPPCSCAHDQEVIHMIVSLIFYLPFTLLTTYSQLLLCYSALPLTSILTPQCSLHFSLVCHLYLLLHSLYYDSLPYQSFSPHDLLSYQTTLATNLTTLAILFSPYTLITFTSCITHLYD